MIMKVTTHLLGSKIAMLLMVMILSREVEAAYKCPCGHKGRWSTTTLTCAGTCKTKKKCTKNCFNKEQLKKKHPKCKECLEAIKKCQEAEQKRANKPKREPAEAKEPKKLDFQLDSSMEFNTEDDQPDLPEDESPVPQKDLPAGWIRHPMSKVEEHKHGQKFCYTKDGLKGWTLVNPKLIAASNGLPNGWTAHYDKEAHIYYVGELSKRYVWKKTHNGRFFTIWVDSLGGS